MQAASPYSVISVTYAVPVAKTTVAVAVASVFSDPRGLNRTLSDTVSHPEAVLLAVTKALADTATPIDGTRAITFVKALADTVTNTDAIDPKIIAFRQVDEVVTAADSAVLAVTKAASDAVSNTDATVLAFTKFLADTGTTAEAVTNTVTKVLADAVTNADATAATVTKAAADTVANSDAGGILMTDYADITYFAEDYVGTSVSF